MIVILSAGNAFERLQHFVNPVIDQTFPKDLLQLGLHLKVLEASVHGY